MTGGSQEINHLLEPQVNSTDLANNQTQAIKSQDLYLNS